MYTCKWASFLNVLPIHENRNSKQSSYVQVYSYQFLLFLPLPDFFCSSIPLPFSELSGLFEFFLIFRENNPRLTLSTVMEPPVTNPPIRPAQRLPANKQTIPMFFNLKVFWTGYSYSPIIAPVPDWRSDPSREGLRLPLSELESPSSGFTVPSSCTF